MIARIEGRLVVKTSETVVIDVGGVGYELSIPLSTYYVLPELGEETVLTVSTFMREDAIRLYGFATDEEKSFFTMLLTISGVGPKLARGILSGGDIGRLKSAIAASDIAVLTKLPGVGKKTAERMALELKDKVRELSIIPSDGSPEGAESSVEEGISADVVSALKNLGYKDNAAEDAVREVLKEADVDEENFELPFNDLLRGALKILST